jgi:hypothetical protein
MLNADVDSSLRKRGLLNQRLSFRVVRTLRFGRVDFAPAKSFVLNN